MARRMDYSEKSAFEAKYIPEPMSGCWLWEASTDGKYGEIQSAGRRVKAHRFSWTLYHGPIPAGISVLHRCDNTFCVNPDHLFLGTLSDNMRDCSNKGRNAMQRHPERSTFSIPGRIVRPYGERHGMSVVNESDVRRIREMARGGASSSVIAAKFGIHPANARKIIAGKSWKHVAPPATLED